MHNSGVSRVYGVACAIAALLLAAATPASAQFKPRPLDDPATGENYHVEAAASLWFPGSSISLSSESLGIPGDLIDFKRDLGLTDQHFPALALQFRPARSHKFRVEFIPISFSQTAALPRDIKFNGQLYHAGLPVNSTLDWKAFRFGYEYDFIVRNQGFVGVIAELKYTDATATLTTATPLIDEFDHAKVPIPAIGGIARYYVVPNISITGELTGFKLPENVLKNSGSGHYVDLDVYGTLNFTDHIGVKGGYRSVDLGYLFKTDTGSFTLKGMYFGAVVRY
jgi:hypothetical protein